MDKPKPDMNTQILLDLQEQMKWMRLFIQDMKMDMKVWMLAIILARG